MKNISKILGVSFLTLTGAISVVSCKNNSNNSSNSQDVSGPEMVFTRIPYLDLSNIPDYLSFKLEEPEGSQGLDYIYIGTRVQLYASDGDFTFNDGVLRMKMNAFYDEESGLFKLNSGERDMRITFKGTEKNITVTKTLLLVDRVITTAEELQRINENPSGSYILGNDIDCSSISNFEPLGYTTTDTSATIGKEFLGVFDGNGYTIKNLTSRYSNTMNSEITQKKTGNYLFENESHKQGDMFGVFQSLGAGGIIRNTGFKNVHIYGRTMSGVICGQSAGTIENCFVDSDCSVQISTHFYDEACGAGGLVGFITPEGTLRNCLSLATVGIENSFDAYGDDYIAENKARLQEEHPDEVIDEYDSNSIYYDELRTWHFYGGKIGFIDSNGVESNNVYAGVGIVHGEARNCFALRFERTGDFKGALNFGQTHIFDNKEGDGPDTGLIIDCAVKEDAELKVASLYSNFDTNAWNIFDGGYPTLKAFYTYEILE